MKRDQNGIRKPILFVSVCLVLLVSLVALFLALYRSHHNRHFEEVKMGNLGVYAQGQGAQAHAQISAYQERTQIVARLIEKCRAGESPAVLREALKEMRGDATLSYGSVEEMQNSDASATGLAIFPEMWEKLAKGLPVVTQIQWTPQWKKEMFGVCAPVAVDGRTVGVVYMLASARELLEQIQQSQMHEVYAQSIVDGQGKILYTDRDDGQSNVLDALRDEGVGEEKLEALRLALEEDTDLVLPLGGRVEGYYCTSISLQFNGWNIVRVLRADGLGAVSQDLWRATVLAGIALATVAAVIVLTLFSVFNAQQRRIAMEQSRYTSLANFSDTVLFEYDVQNDTLTFTPNVTGLLPIKSPVIKDLHLHKFEAMDPKDIPTVLATFDRAQADGRTHSMDLQFLNLEGEWFWCECQIQPIRTPGGQPNLIGKLHDISDQKAKEQALIQQSTFDKLTGVMNRESVEEAINYLLGKGIMGFLFMVDVDNFKWVNDTWGHDAGDDVLAGVGDTLHQTFRERDCVGRIGGDEFVAFMRDADSPETAENKARLILKKLAESREIDCTVSIGIAAAPRHGNRYDKLFKCADCAMYEAKRSGKNGYHLYNGNGEEKRGY